MKKIIFLFAISIIAFSCNKDELVVDQTTADSSFTLGSINPESIPNAEYDNSSKGMYHGVIVTEDAQFHGKIWINVGNDGNYNATVITAEEENISFSANSTTDESEIITYTGTRGSFVVDVTNYKNYATTSISKTSYKPTITNVVIDGINGAVESYKEKSNQRAMAILGTYVDDADPAFTGTWDLISDGTPHPAGAGLVVTEAMVVAPGSGIFTDTAMELADFACFSQVGAPPMLWNDPGLENELWVFEQSSVFGQATATYDLGVSARIRDGNNLGYADVINRTGGPTYGCYISTVQGFWAWNGRTGTISFPVDVPLPSLICGDTFADTGGTIIGYRPDESFERTITSGDGSPLNVYFTEFDLADDTMSVYDGATTGAPLLGTYTASDLLLVEINGSTDALTFVFTSNSATEGSGWATVVCGTAPPPVPPCTGSVTDFTSAPAAIITDAACPTESEFTIPVVLGVGPLATIGTDYSIDNIEIDITHTWVADIEMHIMSPAGTILDLSIANGGDGDNYTDTLFADGGADITIGAAPFTGFYEPQGGLFATTFAGENANGTWTLQICDSAAGDEGTLDSWSISFCDAPAPPITSSIDRSSNNVSIKEALTKDQFENNRLKLECSTLE